MRLSFLLLAFLSMPCGAAVGAPKNAGNFYLLTVTVGTHAANGTPDDWNYTAKELEQIVKRQCGPLFHEVKSNLVPGSQATPKGVLEGIEWLQQNVKEKDLALFYIGSHGGSSTQRGFYLCAKGGTVYGDQIKAALARVPGRVVLVIQACHAGDILLKHPKDPDFLPPNVAAICACKAGQSSHGVMLPPLMEGLHGLADANKDGVVSVGELTRYIEHRISDFFPESVQQAVRTEPKGFDLSAPLAKAAPAKKIGTEVVMAEYKGDWYGGILVPKKDPEGKGRHLVHYFGIPFGEETWVEKGRICPHHAEAVIVKSGGKWYPAALLRKDGDKFHVRYAGVKSHQEETVPKDRIWAYSLAPPPESTGQKK